MLQQLQGNEPVKNALLTALRQKRLAHSIMLCGEPGCGTGFAARCLAADFIAPQGGAAAQAVMEQRSAECITVCGEGASGDIKVDRVRSVCREIYNTSLSAEGRAVIIRGAEHLNEASANTLLKTLEEPPADVLWILTAPSEAAVLPTIRSRCCIYTLAAPGADECEAYLAPKFTDKKLLRRCAELFDGRIGAVQQVMQQRALQTVLADAETLLNALAEKRLYDALVLLAKYEKEKAKALQLLQFAADAAALRLRTGSAATVCFIRQQQQALQRLQGGDSPKAVLADLAAQCTA